MPKVTLEQWRMLKAVVDAGGFAKAAELVHKSPSSINHAVQKLQTQLGLPLLEVQGRRAVLTPSGEALLRRAGQLLEEASDMESLATILAEGARPEITLAVDQIVPLPLVIDALVEFSRQFPNTRVQLFECVLDGGPELLLNGRADLLLGPSVPTSHLGEHVGEIPMVCVVHREHDLAQVSRPLNQRDLRAHRQVAVRATGGGSQGPDAGWLGADQRWTVGHLNTALQIVLSGSAFAWLPECLVREPIRQGLLVPVELETGARQIVPVSLVIGDPDRAGKAAQALRASLVAMFSRVEPGMRGHRDWWMSARCESRAKG